jgi:hypothetical protein
MHYHCRTRVLLGLSLLVLGLGLLATVVHATPESEVTICHYPPGNPGNAHDITVGESDKPAHLAHGDFLGPCAQDCRLHREVCNDNTVCTTDTCNTSNGMCGHTFVDCDDGNVCTTDSCDTIMGCLHDPVSCDDGTECTTDRCDPTTGCAHGTVSCDDQNLCTVDLCENATGCEHIPVTCTAGETCNPTTGECACGEFPTSGLPVGTYQDSCGACSVSDCVLRCRCTDRFQSADLCVRDPENELCHSTRLRLNSCDASQDISNQGGSLTCTRLP